MASERSDRPADGMLAAFKIVIAGGFGAGKTTLVGAVSEVQPLHTEEALTTASTSLDDVSGVEGKTTTTVAMDFGRITISDRLVLYLFGTPGQERFWFMWDELSYGALGAVVLADTRRLDDCFPSVDYFEKCGLPFVIAINCFTDSPQYDPEDVRVALDLGPQTPVMLCDARQPASVKDALITLVEHVLATSPAAAGAPPANPEPAAAPAPAAAPPPAAVAPSVTAPPPPAGPLPAAGPLAASAPPAPGSGPFFDAPPPASGPLVGQPEPVGFSGPAAQPLGQSPVPQPLGQPPVPQPAGPPPPAPPPPASLPSGPHPSAGHPLAGHPSAGHPSVGAPSADAPVGPAPVGPTPVGPTPVGPTPGGPAPVGTLPPAWPLPPPGGAAAPGPGVAGTPAPYAETSADPGQPEPAGPPESPPDAAAPAEREKTGWRSPLSRWRS
jgi:hypothetical protein